MAINQIRAGVVLNYVVIGLNALVGLLYTPYMLRMMGQSEYGLYSIAASIIAYLTIMDFGFGNAIIRYTAKFRAEGRTDEQASMFGMFSLLYMAIGVMALIVGGVVCLNVENLFGETMSAQELSRATIILAIMTVNLALSFPMGIYGFIITAYEDFVFQKTLNIIRILLNTAVMVCLLHFGYKAVAMVVVQTVFNVLTFVANWLYCRRKIRIRFSFRGFRWDFMREVALYSLWIFLNAIMEQFYWSTGQFVLGVFSGTVAVAILSVAIQLKNMYYSFSTAISSVFLPRVTAMIAQGSSDDNISDLFVKVGRIQYIVISFIIVLFIVFGQSFIRIWAGESYAESYVITLLFMLSTMVPLIQNMGITILQARNELKYRSILILIVSVISLVVSIPMAKMFGAQGFAWVVSIAVLLGHGLLLNIYYQRKIHIDIIRFWKEIGKMSIWPILAVVIGLVSIRYFDMNDLRQLTMMIAIYSIVYVAVLYKASINRDEREMISKMILAICRRR